jgi:hypothetical protein
MAKKQPKRCADSGRFKSKEQYEAVKARRKAEKRATEEHTASEKAKREALANAKGGAQGLTW